MKTHHEALNLMCSGMYRHVTIDKVEVLPCLKVRGAKEMHIMLERVSKMPMIRESCAGRT